MKKRKAKRIKPLNTDDIELKITKAIDEQEKLKEEAFINLIVEIIVEKTLNQYYGNDKLL